MNPKIEINSITLSKSKNEDVFTKYDIEVSIDEMQNTDTEIKLKYGLTLLSNPKNARISAEGVATIYGDQTQTAKYLEQDENNIPNILNVIYQELFPLFYMLSKSLQIPCPAYKLSHISSPSKVESQSQDLKEPTPKVEEVNTTESSNLENQMNVTTPEEQQTQERVV